MVYIYIYISISLYITTVSLYAVYDLNGRDPLCALNQIYRNFKKFERRVLLKLDILCYNRHMTEKEAGLCQDRSAVGGYAEHRDLTAFRLTDRRESGK